MAGTPPLVELSRLKLSLLGFWATMGEGRGALFDDPMTAAGAGGVALSRGEDGPTQAVSNRCVQLHKQIA